MFIAENKFKAQKVPSKDLDNWIEFQAPRGEKGEAGRDGKDGNQGATGAAGHDGKDGKQGANGAKGEKGNSGKQGERGRDGKDGKQGEKGPAGHNGKDGEKGDTGKQGLNGEKGEKGDRGLRGVDGKQGEQGLKGDKGERGIAGEKGATGKQGERGNDGTGLRLKTFKIGQKYRHGDYVFAKSSKDHHDSMYIAEKETFVATKAPSADAANWVEFHAPRGVSGEKGDKGEKGDTGERGLKGDKGLKGQQGEQGLKGEDGKQGKKGEDGHNGKNGISSEPKKPSVKIQKALESRSKQVTSSVKDTKVGQLMKSKTRTYNDGRSTCPRVTGANPSELDKYKEMFCPVYRRLDLAQDDVVNVAMVYVQDDIHPDNKDIVAEFKRNARYIVDDGCASPLFAAKDISLQDIAVDGKKNKEWVALVQLDSTSKDGYLQNELAHCKTLDYVPQTRVSVEVKLRTPTQIPCRWNHKLNCGWTYPYLPAKHYHTKRPLEYTVDMTGTTYEYNTGHRRRRRLLARSRQGC